MKITLEAKSGGGELTIEDRELRGTPTDKPNFPEPVALVSISSTVGARHTILVDIGELVRASKALQPSSFETTFM